MTPRVDTAARLLDDEPRSALFAPDANVLDLLPWPVPPGTPPVLFGAERWKLDSITVWPDYSPRSPVLWSSIANPTWRLTAREAAMALMVPQLGIDHRLARARRTPYPPWAIAYQRLSYWRRWFQFLADEGIPTLGAVDQDACAAFRDTITPECRHIAIGAIRVFGDYGKLLTADRYATNFRPWDEKSAAAASGVPKLGDAQNKTDYIPDGVFAPLLASALFLVTEVGPELIRATREIERLRTQKSTWGGARVDFDDRLNTYLQQLRTQGLRLPQASRSTQHDSICLATIALNIGMKESRNLLEPRRWSKISAAAADLGVGPGGLLIGPTHLTYTTNVRALTRIVRTACFIVVAALSGMRASELAAIRRDSCKREVLDGGVVRHRLRSKLLKGEKPGGRRETWTVIEEVVDAIKVAGQLTTKDSLIHTATFADSYRELRDWVNGEIGSQVDLAPIPEDWDLIPRQFRRTLARELAWRPNGVIAGKIHLKHVSVATTEGYAGKLGESANAFVAEVAAEQRAAAEQFTKEVLEAIESGQPVTGLGARELAAAVEALHSADGDGSQARDRDEVVAEFVRARAGVLHVTPLVYCWFLHPDRARCLRGQADKSQPLVASCQPGKCANATIHPQHAPTWLSGIDSLTLTLKAGRVPAGERERINTKIQEMKDVVEPLLKGPE